MNIERLARNVASPRPPRRLPPFILFATFLSTFYIGLIGPILPALVEQYREMPSPSGCCFLAIFSHNSSVRPVWELSAIAMGDEW
jgi:hypothetical protein